MAEQSPQAVDTSNAWGIDLARRELRTRGSSVPIGSRAFEILEILVQSGGELVNKYHLMDRVWPGAVVEENTLQFHISAIRKALGEDRSLLKTVSGRGYRLLGIWTVRPATAQEPRADLPERKPSEPFRTNVPIAGSALIGRSEPRQHLLDLLSAYRVVTLTGPGGIGKSVLALEVARSLFPTFEGDCWLVELASLQKPDLVRSAVAGVLGLQLGGDKLFDAAVARAIGETKLLLVLDNCEHVIHAAAELVETLVRMCPNTSILATSRESLRIDGEYVYRVPPLEVPPQTPEMPGKVQDYSAVQLFVARTKASDSDFSARPENFPTIAAICRRLDGIPLAIEFAASRAAAFGLQQVAARLDDRFRLLTAGRRTALPRHQTLRATLDWSYELLPEPERHVLSRLAIFAGGFTVEAAIAVTSDADNTAVSVADGIASLVARSLVALDGSVPSGRWRLLETIRAYAFEKLGRSGEAGDAARRHAEFYRDLFACMTTGLRSQPSAEVLGRHVREIDNVRAALDWSFSPAGDATVGIVLTAAYAPVWQISGLVGECRERTELALEMLAPDFRLSVPLRMQLHLEYGFALLMTLGPIERTKTELATALDFAESLDDSLAMLRILFVLWAAHLLNGECRAAQSTAEKFLDAARRTGEPADPLVGERLIGNTLQYAGRQLEAQRCLERVLDRYVAPDNQRHAILFQFDQPVEARAMLARVLWLRGFADQAVDHARASLEEAQARRELSLWSVIHYGVYPVELETGDLIRAERAATLLSDLAMRSNAPLWKIIGDFLKGKLLIRRGEFTAGLVLIRAALEACEKTGWTIGQAEYLGALGEGLGRLGQLTEAARAIDQALAVAERGGERWYVAELLRFKGELLLRRPGDFLAGEKCIESALEVAREQDALSWELRAAMSLARVRMRQDRPDEARQVLAPVYERFTEGFNTADLRAASAMLETPRANRV